MPVPELNPLVLHTLVCHDCGIVLEAEAIKGKRGGREIVTHIQQTCKKCHYTLETNDRISAQTYALREDGSLVKL